MSWKERAIKPDSIEQTNDWRSRAVSLDEINANTPSYGQDVKTLVLDGMTLGAGPAAGGVGGGIGRAAAELTRNDIGLVERLKNLPSSFAQGFSEARTDTQNEIADAQARNPKTALVATVGTGLATAPLLALKGMQAAKWGTRAASSAKLGLGLGAAQAAGKANSLEEAGQMIGAGGLIGGGAQIGGDILTKGVLPAAGKVAGYVGNKVAGGAKKLASALTGVDEQVISTYAKRADQVKELVKRFGDDTAAAADHIRETIGRDIQVTRQKLGNQIGDALNDPKYAETFVDARSIIKSIDEGLAKIGKVTAKFRPDEINELKNVRDLIRQISDGEGRIGVKALAELKEELQAIAKPSYNNGATIFPRGDLAAKFAKNAAGEARRLLNSAVPEIKRANEQLSRLHQIEAVMNKNLIRPGKPEAALLGAGGGNRRSAKLLQSIDKVTGGNALEQAENLAAAKHLGNAPLLPGDTTGKAAARIGSAFLAGNVMAPGYGSIAPIVTSPAALKLTMDTGNFLARMASATGRVLTPPQAVVQGGRQAVQQGLVKETSAAQRHADGAIERRIQEIQKKRKIK